MCSFSSASANNSSRSFLAEPWPVSGTSIARVRVPGDGFQGEFIIEGERGTFVEYELVTPGSSVRVGDQLEPYDNG